MKTQKTYGKTIEQVNGFQIKPLLDSKGNPTGMYGLFHGKKKLEEYSNIDKAKKDAKNIHDKKYYSRDLVNKLERGRKKQRS
jgi:hypothetical protein